MRPRGGQAWGSRSCTSSLIPAGGIRGGRAGVSAHWLSSGPRDSAAVAATGKSKAFQPLEAKKTLFPGPIHFTLRDLTMWPPDPPSYFSGFPQDPDGSYCPVPSEISLRCQEKKKKNPSSGSGTRHQLPLHSLRAPPRDGSPFQGSRSYLWVSCMQLPSLLRLLPPPV